MIRSFRIPWVAAACLVILTLAGCNFPTSNLPGTPSVEAVYTSAAETISAQLTSLASTSQPDRTLSPAEETIEPEGEPTEPPDPTETSTLTTTPTPEDTATPTIPPSPTLSTFEPIASLGEPTWQDNFESAVNWSPYEDEYVRFNIREGRLVMLSKKAESRDSWMLSWPNPEDFYIEMTAATEECSGLDRYGLIFLSDSDSGYLYGLSCDGRYSFRTWDGERFSILIDWTESAHILTQEGEINRLGVLAEGNQFRLYVNGMLVDETADNTYREGSFGVFVGSPNTENFRVVVSQFSYWELP